MLDLDLKGKRVLLREDFNVPINDDGKIISDVRIRAALPTIKHVLAQNGAVILLSHRGRPLEGSYDQAYTLAPVAQCLQKLLEKPVKLIYPWVDGFDIQPGEVVLCENVRFNEGETSNNAALAKKIAALGDVFVMDAFATAHRAHASTHGVACYIPVACAGPLLMNEVTAINQAIEAPAKPVVAIVGGAKVSTKIDVLKNLVKKVDTLIVGGGIANTFLAASGFPVGKSLYEANCLNVAEDIFHLAEELGVDIPLPADVVVASEFSSDAPATVRDVKDVSENDMILDIGPKTSEAYRKHLQQANTILWNGPVGVFEFPAFSKGTETLANTIANSSAFSIAGGGDTIAAIEKFAIQNAISYVSTGGGAFLELLEGKTLPGIEVLQQRGNEA